MTSWKDLNHTLLEQIFAHVCKNTDAAEGSSPFLPNPSLTQVCRHWRDVYTNSYILWRCIHFDWEVALLPTAEDKPSCSTWQEDEGEEEEEEEEVGNDHNAVDKPYNLHNNTTTAASSRSSIFRLGYIVQWLQERATLFEHLHFTNCQVLGPALNFQLQPLLCSHASNLVSLDLSGLQHHQFTTTDTYSIISSLSQASAAPTLRHLKLTWRQPHSGATPLFRLSSASLQSLTSLRALESVHIEVDGILGSTADLAVWSTLQNLTCLHLSGRMEAFIVHPDMLAALSTLQRLELSNVRLPQFSPAMVKALGAVTALCLTGVLAAKPRRKSGFALWDALPGLQSLRCLSISGAGQDCQLPAAALKCPRLQSLTFSDCSHLGSWPAVADLLYSSHSSSTSTSDGDAYPAFNSLQHLQFINIGLTELPPAALWRRCTRVQSFTWRAVHRAAPRHRYWDKGSPCQVTDEMKPMLRMLRVLRYEYSGIHHQQGLLAAVSVLKSGTSGGALQELSLEGNRIGSGCVIDAFLSGGDELSGLRRLSLVNCCLRKISGGELFSGMTALEELDLRNNPMLVLCEDEHENDEHSGALKRISRVLRNDPGSILMAAASKSES